MKNAVVNTAVVNTAVVKSFATKTLFLDFDGVLHDKYAAEWPGHDNFAQIMADPFCFCFVNDLVSVLSGYESEVDIVVHSGWRLNEQFSHDQLRAFIRELGPRFRGTTPTMMDPDRFATQRYDSILQYVGEHAVKDYRILDDDVHAFPRCLRELIACDPQWGVSDSAVQAKLLDWLVI